jgi:hypothetical protein
MSKENYERSGWGRVSDGSPMSLGRIRQGIPKAAVDQVRKIHDEKVETAETSELPTYQQAWSGMTPEEQSAHGSYEGFVQSAQDWWSQQGKGSAAPLMGWGKKAIKAGKKIIKKYRKRI